MKFGEGLATPKKSVVECYGMSPCLQRGTESIRWHQEILPFLESGEWFCLEGYQILAMSSAQEKPSWFVSPGYCQETNLIISPLVYF